MFQPRFFGLFSTVLQETQWMDHDKLKKQQTGHEETNPKGLTLASFQVKLGLLCAASVAMATHRVKLVQRRENCEGSVLCLCLV